MSVTHIAEYAHLHAALVHADARYAWSFPPLVVSGLIVSATLYAIGLRRLWAQAGSGRGIDGRGASAFYGGLLAIAVALLSPVDTVGEALFSMHMAQHLLLVVVAAPLLVLGEPLYVMMFALPGERRRAASGWWLQQAEWRAVVRGLTAPAVAWCLHVATLWAWHLPRLYDAAMRHEGLHVLEHLMFLLTAILFWSTVIGRQRAGVGVAALSLFGAALQCTLLGTLLSLSRHAWYDAHRLTTTPWGFTPLEDQQLAGLIMWIPSGLVYLAALLLVVATVLRNPARPLHHGTSGTP